MKTFALLKAGIFLALLFIAGIILQSLIDRGLKKSSFDNYKEWNDMLHSNINADLIVQGASKVVVGVSPYLLDSTLKLNSYNLGIDGFQFHVQYYRLMFYLKYNKKPKYIIQNVDELTLDKDIILYEYNQFLPYLDNEEIKKAVISYNGFLDWKDLYIPMYKYHSEYSLATRGLINNFHRYAIENDKYKGFQPIDRLWENKSFKQVESGNLNKSISTVSDSVQLLFKDYLDFCKAEKIKIIFICPPTYFEVEKYCINKDSILDIYKNFSSAYNIPFLDYSKDSISMDTANFYEAWHLNAVGARKFTLKLARDLKGIIK